jgi:polar amino acid transport system substrate-binding protein
MKHLRKFMALGVLAGSLITPALAASTGAPVLLTLEWPPYTGSKLPGNGWNSARIRQVYAAQGREVRIGFFSWRRALSLPYSDHRFAGYFPEYPSPRRQSTCNYSSPIGTSSVGIAEPDKRPLQWQTVDDLQRYRIGVVTAYVNEDRFDSLAAAGKIKTRDSADDEHNLLQLGDGKVDGAIIDPRVFAWLMQNDAALAGLRGHLQMNAHLLTTWPLVVCFRPDADGAAERDAFNATLAHLPAATAAGHTATVPAAAPSHRHLPAG